MFSTMESGKLPMVQAHFSLLCFTLWCFVDPAFVFYKLSIYGKPASSMFTSTVFPTAFAHSVSSSHFGNSHRISHLDVYYIHIVICLWCYYNSWKAHLIYFFSNILKIRYVISIAITLLHTLDRLTDFSIG